MSRQTVDRFGFLGHPNTIKLCGCVSFLVVAGNSSQNENMFLQKNLIGLLYYDPLADVCILVPEAPWVLN